MPGTTPGARKAWAHRREKYGESGQRPASTSTKAARTRRREKITPQIRAELAALRKEKHDLEEACSSFRVRIRRIDERINAINRQLEK